MKKSILLTLIVSLMALSQASSQTSTTKNQLKMENQEHYTFLLSNKISREKVTFKNRYGITLSGDLYTPKNIESGKHPALAISGPFGAVKEQSSGLYANELAARGFIPKCPLAVLCENIFTFLMDTIRNKRL